MIFVFQDIFDRSHIFSCATENWINDAAKKFCQKTRPPHKCVFSQMFAGKWKESFCSVAPLWDEKWTGTDGISWQQQLHVLTLVEQFLLIWTPLNLHHLHDVCLWQWEMLWRGNCPCNNQIQLVLNLKARLMLYLKFLRHIYTDQKRISAWYFYWMMVNIT